MFRLRDGRHCHSLRISYIGFRFGAMMNGTPDSKVHGDNMGPIWGWQDPGGPHVGPMNLAIWDHEADSFLKCPCLAKFCTFYGTLKFSMIGLVDNIWGMTLPLWWHCHSIFMGWYTEQWNRSSFRKAMHDQFLLVLNNFEIFHDRLEAGLREDITTLTH